MNREDYGEDSMNIGDLKKKVLTAIDENREKIIHVGETILSHPELGYKEVKTSSFIKEIFDSLQLEYEDSLAITGIKARLKGRSSKLKIAVIGEMDAVISPLNPNADILTGASHSCGHNAQVATMIGVAYGLIESKIMGELDGDIAFMAVPAEEFVELEYREHLKNSGKIEFFGGKQELIRLGAFDDIDMAMMVHSHGGTRERKVFIHGGGSGFVGKTVRFVGKEAHAGGAPYEGINALNAAMMAMMGIHTQREVFKDEDGIRVHPIITKGGDLVNIVPADVRMETYVRGKSVNAILNANELVNRAIRAGAYCVGAEVTINEIPGYLPLKQNINIGELFAENISEFIGEENIVRGVDMFGSTDIGDLSSIMPIIQPTMGGFKGQAHSKDFEIVDKEAAYILPAKAMAMTIIDLLYNEAQVGTQIKEDYVPLYSKDEYLKLWDEFLKDKN